jgi:hypothetical protein
MCFAVRIASSQLVDTLRPKRFTQLVANFRSLSCRPVSTALDLLRSQLTRDSPLDATSVCPAMQKLYSV